MGQQHAAQKAEANLPINTPPTNQPHLPTPGAVHPLLHLQRTIGNRAVQGLIQTKLKIGQPDDKYEQEADRVANQVMRMPAPGVQRQVEPEEEEEEILQTKPLAGQIIPLIQRQVEDEEEDTIQPKLLSGKRAGLIQRQLEDEDEEESLQPKSLSEQTPAPLVQRKCVACASGQGLCPTCAREEEGVQRKTLASTITPVIQRQNEKPEEEVLQTEPVFISLVQRQVEEEEEEEEESIQAKPPSGQISPLVQPQVVPDEEEEEETIRPKPISAQTRHVTSDLGARIQSLKGGGQSLTESARAFFEPRFGHDFSRVRIHTGGQAGEVARFVNARAFTVGRDIVFGPGQYSPGTTTGKRILAHELTHVIQQSKSRPELGIQRKIGFEFEMNYSGEDQRPPTGSPTFGEVRSKKNHFKIKMDGPRMEVVTDPFEENRQGRTDLKKAMDALVKLGKSLQKTCRKKGKRIRSGGKVLRWFKPPSSFGSTSLKAMYPLRSGRGDRKKVCRLGASPQATLGIRLEKFGDLVKKIRKSRGTKIPLTGKFNPTKKSGRLGLTSEILFEAQNIVAKSRDREIRRNTALGNGKRVDASTFSIRLANFITLLVSYLRTSVMLDERDYERYAKGYPPIVAHSDMTEIYKQLLNDDERKVFVKLYGDSSARRNLFALANEKLRKSKVKGRKVRFVRGKGDTNLYPPKVSSSYTWDRFVEDIVNKISVFRKISPAVGSKKGPEEIGPSGSRSRGMVVELRRLGFKMWRVRKWKELALHIYDMVRELNR